MNSLKTFQRLRWKEIIFKLSHLYAGILYNLDYPTQLVMLRWSDQQKFGKYPIPCPFSEIAWTDAICQGFVFLICLVTHQCVFSQEPTFKIID